VAFVGIVRPRREDEQTAFGNGIKQKVGGLEILTETVIGDVDDGVFFLEENMEHLLFMLRDERRDHNCALTSGENTAVLVITKRLVVAVLFSILHPHTTDVDWAVVIVLEEGDIPHTSVGAVGDVDVGLYTEEAGLDALGSEAYGVHLNVADHGLELTGDIPCRYV